MDKFLKSLERLATAKGIVVLVIVLLVVFFTYKNLDFITEVTFKVDRPSGTNEPPADPNFRAQENRKASFSIVGAQLTPVDFALPVSFYAELRNDGFATGGVEVMVDFGRAAVDTFEIRPANGYTLISGGIQQNTLKVQFPSVARDESVHLYALLTMPTFREVVANPIGEGLQSRLTYDAYIARSSSRWLSSDFRVFLQFVAGGIIIVMAIYLTYVLIAKLSILFRMT